MVLVCRVGTLVLSRTANAGVAVALAVKSREGDRDERTSEGMRKTSEEAIGELPSLDLRIPVTGSAQILGTLRVLGVLA